MTNVPWASPQALGRLTVPQLLCLTSEHAPDEEEEITSFEDYMEAVNRKHAKERAWNQ